MKKILLAIATVIAVGAMLQGCGTKNEIVNTPQPSVSTENNTTIGNNNTEITLTKEMAYEGVDNYCHSEYDWSVAEDNPSIMYVEMGEETDIEYQVVFHSYTGAVVYFYVDKSNGTTRMVEYVPTLDVENEVGTINIYDYLNK